QWQVANQIQDATQPMPIEELMTLLSQLEQHFKDYNTDALTLVEQIIGLKVLQPKKLLLEELKQAAGQFDFSLALERLIELRAWAEKHQIKDC
ncbi:MAG: hypothetical protein ACRCWP_05880, partial [Shewanella sp.]